MRRFITCCCLLGLALSAAPLFAQEKLANFLLKEVVPFGNDGFVVVYADQLTSPRAMRLQFYSLNNEKLAEVDVSLERKGLLAQFEGAFAWDGQFNLLTSLYYPGPQRNHLILQQFEVPSLQELGGQIVDEAYTPQLYRVPFGYGLSPDSTKIMFYSWTYTLPEDPAKVTVTVLDRELKQLWQRRYILPYKNETLFIYNCRMTDDGQAYLLCENYLGKPGPNIDENKIEYFVLVGQSDSENMIIYKLNPAGKALRGMKIEPGPENSMVGAAYYQVPGGGGGHDGLLVFRIPPKGGQLEQNFLPITKEEYAAAYLFGEKETLFNANRRRFGNFEVKSVKQGPDGSVTVVGEQVFYDEINWSLEFNDILVVRTTTQGDRIAWMHRLPKRQGGQPDFTKPYSFAQFELNGRQYFLYNDLPENFQNGPVPRSLGEYEGFPGAVVMMEVSPKGNIRLFALTQLIRQKGLQMLWPSLSWEVSRDLLLFFGPMRTGGVLSSYLLAPISWQDLLSQPAFMIEKPRE